MGRVGVVDAGVPAEEPPSVGRDGLQLAGEEGDGGWGEDGEGGV